MNLIGMARWLTAMKAGALAVCVMFLAVGCDQLKELVGRPDERVSWSIPAPVAVPDGLKDAVLTFWSHYVRREWDACYGMETPKNRESIPQKRYRQYYEGGYKTEQVDINQIELASDGKVATVRVTLTHEDPRTEKLKETSLRDTWVYVDDGWHHFFNDPVIQLRDWGRRPVTKP